MDRTICGAALLAASVIAGCGTNPARTPSSLTLTLRSRVKADGESYKPLTKSVRWDPKKTAFVICDMWDGHWCKGAARRVSEMAVPMNRLIETVRSRGVFIIHAPSSVTDFYKDTPGRRRAQNAPLAKPPVELTKDTRWETTWCWPDEDREPGMPIDDSDMGCDCEESCLPPRKAWTRQNAAIEIDQARDAITDNAQETYNLLQDRGIDNVVLLGVHLNMCVLGRPFGIRQMTYVKKNVALIRDMTDTMYNSRKKPFVNHHTGTDLVVEHVEKFWCPSFTSADLTGGKPFRFKDDTRKNPAP